MTSIIFAIGSIFLHNRWFKRSSPEQLYVESLGTFLSSKVHEAIFSTVSHLLNLSWEATGSVAFKSDMLGITHKKQEKQQNNVHESEIITNNISDILFLAKYNYLRKWDLRLFSNLNKNISDTLLSSFMFENTWELAGVLT